SIFPQDIQRALLPDEALIDIVRYQRFEYADDPEKDAWAGWQYGAFVIAGTDDKSNRGAFSFVPLGNAGELDQLTAAWLTLVSSPPVPRGGEELRRASLELTKRVWTPLQPHLSGTVAIYVSPDS